MLPPFIIEQIRKREEDERRRKHESVIQLPLPEPIYPTAPRDRRDEVSDRGIVIIDLGGG